ncbi:RNA polymerase sigma factor [Shouchella shacheensis]|uniref:RNA polymerase sigma factor n=1 Tax=Shouchella shacheensis TaxID=1649580 RepID=UPI00073FB55F|nr:hypothetical protein [Shouchella shacheensis]
MSLEHFMKINHRFFSNPLIQSFIDEPDHASLLRRTVEKGDQSASKQLDERFEDFFLKVRMIRYIDRLSTFYVKSYDQKRRKNHRQLTLDAPAGFDQDESQTELSKLPSKEPSPAESVDRRIPDLLTDKESVRLYQSFSEKKKNVLEWSIVHQLSNKEIAGLLDCTPQNVSKLKAHALRQLQQKGGQARG